MGRASRSSARGRRRVRGGVPPIYNAVRILDDGAEGGVPIDVIAEVEQHLGENRVAA